MRVVLYQDLVWLESQSLIQDMLEKANEIDAESEQKSLVGEARLAQDRASWYYRKYAEELKLHALEALTWKGNPPS